MRGKVALVLSFFGVVPFFLFCLILYSLFLLYENNNSPKVIISTQNIHYKALPQERRQTIITIPAGDARKQVLKEFFAHYKSPLAPFANDIVTAADKYGIDYRLLPAIAMQESNVCKKIPKNSYNCWGFGIYGGKVKRFANYQEAIDTVSKTLAKEYKQKGFEEPHEIMTKYTPSSNGSWANSVSFFMSKLQAAL